MSIMVANSRFITSSLRAGFYQQFTSELFKGFHNKQFFYNLAEQLACVAHNAYTMRHMDVVEQTSLILQNLPVSSEYKNVGSYYQALSMKKQGRVTEACALLELIVDHMPIRYRARGIQLLGMIHHAKGDFHSALTLYVDACKIAASNNGRDLHTTVTAFQNIAVLKSMNGDHKQAVVRLEQLFPIVYAISKVEPYKYHHYLNSYAVELGEVGRVEEAQNVCRITLASPFINAYPEWRETWQDLALRGYKSRSVVSVPELPLNVKDNVVPMPANTNPIPIRKGRGKLFDLQKLRKKMVKEPNDENEDIKNMDEKDLFLKLMQLSTQDDITRKKLLKLVEYAIKVVSEPD